ncbi:MAG: pitrilysin family protein [Elusimicrobiaceae bacterium]|nr:pitrilysin family protein [Elusimicrobiaceae bacterium]
MTRVLKPLLSAAAVLALAALAVPLGAEPPKLPAPKPLSFTPPQGERIRLPNGLDIRLLRDSTLPVVRACALVRTGSLHDPPGKTGLARLAAASMRAGGTKKTGADELNERLEFSGSGIEIAMTSEYAEISMFALAPYAAETLALFAEIIQAPAFEPEKVETERGVLLETLRRRNNNPKTLALREAQRAYFGPDSPYGRREEPDTINAVSAADLKAFHERYFRPDGTAIAVAGDFDPAEMAALLSLLFSGWGGKAVPPPEAPAPSSSGTRHVFYIKKPVANAPVVVVQAGPQRNSPDQYAWQVLNQILGGYGMSSRLFEEVRTKRGLAYSVFGETLEFERGGALLVYAGTKNKTVPETIKAVLAQLDMIGRAGVSDEELARAKNNLVSSCIFQFASPIAALRERIRLAYFGYPPDYPEKYAASIGAVTKTGVLDAAQRLNPESAKILVVGDENLFSAPLTEFGAVTELKEN